MMAMVVTMISFLSWNSFTTNQNLTTTNRRKPSKVYSHDTATTTNFSPHILKLLDEHPSSFWDCHRPETPCRYFDPSSFFHSKEGAGFAFQNSTKELGGTNKNLPAMTALSWSSPSSSFEQMTLSLPRNISFIHIHKCGGTTVKTILAKAKQDITTATSTNIQAEIYNYKYSFGGGSVARKERNQQLRLEHIQGMKHLLQKQQQHNTKTNAHAKKNNAAVVFSVVRDPLERFVSAVQQVMHYHDDFRQACLKRSAQATLQCAMDYVGKTQYLRDVHLIPMVMHFRLWDIDMKARPLIAVLHLQDMPILAEYFARAVVATDTMTTNTTIRSSSSNSIPHGRDRSKVEYATSPVLAQMSIDKDCTPDMVRQLCKLYAIDVAFMDSLGYQNAYCTSQQNNASP